MDLHPLKIMGMDLMNGHWPLVETGYRDGEIERLDGHGRAALAVM